MHPFPDKRRAPGLPKRVLFLNDVGFQYGAGIAQARQVEALLSLGIETGVITWAPGGIELEAVGTRPIDPDLWLGIRDVDHLEGGKKMSDAAVVAGLLAEVARFNPEVIIVGNLHAARWPFSLLPALAGLGCRVLAFLHDAYLYTGRCAYPGTCQLYLTGCDETCPTAGQYPKLAPELIPGAWRLRRAIFGGPEGIGVVANSHWSKQMFKSALPAGRSVETVELGADARVYQPGNKDAARTHLGLPLDKPIVLCAAVNFQEERKGCLYLREIIASLQGSVNFAAFGHNAGEIAGLIGLGYHLRADQLALCYQAADVFLGTATEEAFGQTIMEAQLCGLPTVAFSAGGVSEIVRNEITGKLVRVGDSAEAVAAIRTLLADPAVLTEFAAQARKCAANRFSLEAQAERWHRYLTGRLEKGSGHNPPVLAYPLIELEDLKSTARHRPSWPFPELYLNPEHEQLATQTMAGGGALRPGDLCKLYEMGHQTGDIILEIDPDGGPAGITALRGALAHPTRTLRPQYIGIQPGLPALARARRSLVEHELAEYSHLYQRSLQDFIARGEVTPTLVVLSGRRDFEETTAILTALSGWLQSGTPVFLPGFLSKREKPIKDGLRRAAEEWEGAGLARFMGCFGSGALYTTLTSIPGS